MTDCIKEGEVVDQVWAEEGPSLYTRSLRGVWGGWGGALTRPEGRLLFWQRVAHAVASGVGVKGLTHLLGHLQET